MLPPPVALLGAGGKPSTWFAPGGSIEHRNHARKFVKICSPVNLRIRHVGCREHLRKSSLVLICSLAISLRTNGWIASATRLKHLHAINMFALAPVLPRSHCYYFRYLFYCTSGLKYALRVIEHLRPAVDRQPGHRRGNPQSTHLLHPCRAGMGAKQSPVSDVCK